MDLLRLDRLSEAQAATILGLARWELLDLMGRYDGPAVRMSIEELDRELATEVSVPTRHDRFRCRPDKQTVVPSRSRTVNDRQRE